MKSLSMANAAFDAVGATYPRYTTDDPKTILLRTQVNALIAIVYAINEFRESLEGRGPDGVNGPDGPLRYIQGKLCCTYGCSHD